MKKVVISIMAMGITACGPAEMLHSLCGNGIACRAVFGERDDVQDLESQRQNAALQAQINSLNSLLAVLQSSLALLQASQSGTQAQVNDLAAQLSAVELAQQDMLVQLAELQGRVAVAQIIDPCGNAPAVVDEVLLKLTDGSLLASFSDNSSGKNTRFAVVPAGNYVTTDGSSCMFHVSSSGAVTW